MSNLGLISCPRLFLYKPGLRLVSAGFFISGSVGGIMEQSVLMLGNEAIARGLYECGCAVATAYPGTPSSEILSSVASIIKQEPGQMHVQWAVNEKVAFEIAYAAAITGLRAAVSMKQVGLNVASDPLMSAAYMGTKGGFVIVSADDPGPHSSQTEQDSRLSAMAAKIPVLDPDSPDQAKKMIKLAFELSERYEIPVMLRPTTRVCHSRQDIPAGAPSTDHRKPGFEKDPARWAATPKFRFHLHRELENKLVDIALDADTAPRNITRGKDSKRAVVVSGVAAAHAKEIVSELGLMDAVSLYQVLQPFPLHTEFRDRLLDTYEDILVIEETTGVIEMQLAERSRVKGKVSGFVPRVGELLPEAIQNLIETFAGIDVTSYEKATPGGRRPTLCAGCPHRASFFAIKKASPKGIFTSDIGCYTLGLNMGAVDTVLCMGAAVGQAAGFYHAYRNEDNRPDIIATIGDSTFFHAGIPPLIDAVVQNIPFVLVILDNRTTAMTGNQPTPATGVGATGEKTAMVDIASLVKGCGVNHVKTGDPYCLDEFIPMLKEAVAFSKANGPAVVIARHPCILYRSGEKAGGKPREVEITESCDGCAYCITHFECPALVLDEESERVAVDRALCTGCGVCFHVCPKNSIQERK